MKIFVVGQHGSGLSAFSTAIGKEFNLPVISASDWVENLVDRKSINKQDHIDVVTEITLRELRENLSVGIDYIKSKFDLEKPVIVEGCRNPRDFIQLFDPLHDVVVFLNRKENPYTTSSFEMGVVVIDNYVDWTANIALLEKDKRINYLYTINELSSVVDNFIKFLRYKDWCLICGDQGCQHQRV